MQSKSVPNIRCQDITANSLSQFRDDLSATSWEGVFFCSSVDTAYESFMTIVISICKRYFRYKKKKKKSKALTETMGYKETAKYDKREKQPVLIILEHS